MNGGQCDHRGIDSNLSALLVLNTAQMVTVPLVRSFLEYLHGAAHA